MSAFMCSDAHISALVNAAVEYEIGGAGFTSEEPAELFAELVCENAESLRARYGARAALMFDSGPHRFIPGSALPALHVMKLAQSYRYQSCEHDGWGTSKAKRWIANLISGLIYRLPGYDAAPWSI
jgi:hypothetical protein